MDAFSDTGMPTTNLYRSPTPFIGRKKEISILSSYFKTCQILTVLGPPGVGKTRLAKEYALSQQQKFTQEEQGGVWFLDLTEAKSPEELCIVLSRVLTIPFSRSHSLSGMVKQLGQALFDRGPSFLIFDNFEQLVSDAASILEQWSQHAPRTFFLITSREKLQILSEKTFSLSPLLLPQRAEEFRQSEAVQLFLERVKMIRGKYEPSTSEFLKIVKLVEALDGLPLAIELAAARMRVLTCSQLLKNLENRLDFLKTKYTGEQKRYQTLRGAIEWSWNLLLPYEKQMLSSCTVFQGGFSLEAAQAILDLSAYSEASDVSEVLESLLDKSLLHFSVPKDFPGDIRFGMYESIREFVKEKWKQNSEKESIETRHRAYYLRMGNLWSTGVYQAEGSSYFAHLALEQENLFSIFKRFRGTKPQFSAKAILILAPLFLTRGPSSTYLDWLNQSSQIISRSDKTLWATLYLTRAKVHQMRGFFSEAEADITKALSFAKEEKLLFEEGLLLQQLGHLYAAQGRPKEILPCYERALILFRQTKKQTEEAFLLRDIAGTKHDLGEDQETCLAIYQEALQLARSVKNLKCEQLVIAGCGIIYYEQGLYQKALSSFQKGLLLAQKIGDLRAQAMLLSNCSTFYMEQDNYQEGLPYVQQSLSLARRVGDTRSQRVVLFSLVEMYREQGFLQKAWQNFEIAFSLSTQSGDQRRLSLLLSSKGRLYQEEGKFEKTKECYQKLRKLPMYSKLKRNHLFHLSNFAYFSLEQENYQKALTYYQQALKLAQEIGETRYEGILSCEIGRVFHFQTKTKQALEKFQSALKKFQQAPTLKYEGITNAYQGVLLAQTGKISKAKKHFEIAKTKLSKIQNPFWKETLRLLSAHLALGQAQQTLQIEQNPSVKRYLEQVADTLQNSKNKKVSDALMLSFSSELRLAKRLLETNLTRFEEERQSMLAQSEKITPERKASPISFGKNVWWFQAPGTEKAIRLEKRPRLRSVLQILLQYRENHPGQALSVASLFQAGWPNESAHPDSARNRVYSIIKTLRNFGLRHTLLRRDNGYLLDPDVPVVKKDI